jgi:DNA-binding transcriptional LysR family regulator
VGVVRLNEFSAAPCVRDGTLVPVLRRFECRDNVEMMALYPHERHRLPRVRAMLDFLVESFAHSPWRGGFGEDCRAVMAAREPAASR